MMKMKKIRLLAINALALAFALPASAATVAHWTFDDPALGAADQANLPDSDGGTVWRMAAEDKSGNGNALTTWESAWAGFKWVADSYKGDFAIEATGSCPATMTWSAQSLPTGVVLESWTPTEFTIEAIFQPAPDGNRTIVGRDGRDVLTGSGSNAPLYFQQRSGWALGFMYADMAGTWHDAISESNVIVAGNWYYMVGVTDGTNQTLYLANLTAGTDFEVVASSVIESTDPRLATGSVNGDDWTAGSFTVGRGLWAGGHTDRFLSPGLIDEVAISDKALSLNQLVLKAKAEPVLPKNNARKVALNQDLSWAINDENVTHIDLYFHTDSEPNLYQPAYKVLSHVPATTTSWDTGTMEYSTTYYWAIDTYEPNSPAPGDIEIKTVGPVYKFTTIDQQATADEISPAKSVVSKGTDLVLTVEAFNAETYKWFKVGSPDIALADGANYSGTTTDTLTILDVQVEDEGEYYCQVDNSTTEPTNSPFAMVMTQRIMSLFTFEDLTDGVTTDSVSSYGMTVLSDDEGTDLPVLAEGVSYLAPDAYGLLFDNSDSEDPAFYAQYAQVDAGVLNYTDLTISVWCYWNGGAEWQRIIDFGNDTDHYVFLCPNTNTGNLRFAVKNGTEQSISADALPTAQWAHVVATLSGNTAKLYVNGELKTSGTISHNPSDFNAQLNYVGKSQWPDPYFNGKIDNLRIYNYALSTVEVAREYLDDVKSGSVCNMEGEADLTFDINDDCIVDMLDFAQFATTWLNSNLIDY